MTGRLLSRSGSNESKTYTLSKMKKKITLIAVVLYVVFVLFVWRFPWAAMEDGDVDFAVFTSASTVKGFAASLDGLDFTKVKAVCIGKQTRAAAESYGMKTWMAEKATLPALVECVKQAASTIR